MTVQPKVRRRAWLHRAAPLTYFVVLTLGMTWPLSARLSNSVVGQIGDNVYFIWLFGWFEKALFVLHQSPFFVPQLNYPEGWSLAHTEIVPCVLALGMPVSLLAGPITAYNVSLLLTFVISGYFTHLWIRGVSGSSLAGLAAGTIFAFAPYRMAHFLSGHLNLASTMWFPLFFWGLLGWLGEEAPQRKHILLAGVGLGLIALTSMYYFYMTMVVSTIVAAAWLLWSHSRMRRWRFWKQGVQIALVAAPLVALGVLPFWQLEGRGELAARDVQSVTAGSASLSDFLLPSTDHFLWGNWVGEHFVHDHWMEGSLYLGVVAVGLASLAVLRRRDIAGRSGLVILLCGTALVAFILALGTYLHWNESVVQVDIPFGLRTILERDRMSIRLPGYYFFEFLPFYSRMRVFKRFAVFVLLAIAGLAGLGTAWLAKRVPPRQRTGWGVIVLALLLFDFYPGPYADFSRIEARPVDRWLAEQPGSGAVLQLPSTQLSDQIQVYYTLEHGKPFLGGFFNAFPPKQYKRIRPLPGTIPGCLKHGTCPRPGSGIRARRPVGLHCSWGCGSQAEEVRPGADRNGRRSSRLPLTLEPSWAWRFFKRRGSASATVIPPQGRCE